MNRYNLLFRLRGFYNVIKDPSSFLTVIFNYFPLSVLEPKKFTYVGSGYNAHLSILFFL